MGDRRFTGCIRPGPHEAIPCRLHEAIRRRELRQWIAAIPEWDQCDAAAGRFGVAETRRSVLDVFGPNGIIIPMNKQAAPITDLLRQTIADAVESGETNFLALERETDITRASIMRFVAGRQSLRLDLADRLAERFGLELRKRKKG